MNTSFIVLGLFFFFLIRISSINELSLLNNHKIIQAEEERGFSPQRWYLSEVPSW